MCCHVFQMQGDASKFNWKFFQCFPSTWMREYIYVLAQQKKIDKDMRVTSQEAPGLIVLELINFNLEKEFL